MTEVTQSDRDAYRDALTASHRNGSVEAAYRVIAHHAEQARLQERERLRELADGDCEPMHPDEDGWSEWIHPLPGYRMQCCDCGLVHEMQFEITRRSENAHLNPGESDEAVIIFRARREVYGNSHRDEQRRQSLNAMVEMDEELGLLDDTAFSTNRTGG